MPAFLLMAEEVGAEDEPDGPDLKEEEGTDDEDAGEAELGERLEGQGALAEGEPEAKRFAVSFEHLERFVASDGQEVTPLLVICLPSEVIITDLDDLEACRDTTQTGGKCVVESKDDSQLAGRWVFSANSRAYAHWSRSKTLPMGDELAQRFLDRMHQEYQARRRAKWGDLYDRMFSGS